VGRAFVAAIFPALASSGWPFHERAKLKKSEGEKRCSNEDEKYKYYYEFRWAAGQRCVARVWFNSNPPTPKSTYAYRNSDSSNRHRRSNQEYHQIIYKVCHSGFRYWFHKRRACRLQSDLCSGGNSFMIAIVTANQAPEV
jgi:hypothetical protein